MYASYLGSRLRGKDDALGEFPVVHMGGREILFCRWRKTRLLLVHKYGKPCYNLCVSNWPAN